MRIYRVKVKLDDFREPEPGEPEPKERKREPPPPLALGRHWEHNATRIVFDVSAWADAFGAGSVRLLHQRQSDAAPYPVAIQRTDADGTENNATGTLVLWDVSRTDTAQLCHYGRAELRYYSGTEGAEDFLAKSETYKTIVEDALGASLAEAPETERHWLDVLLESVEDIDDKVEDASDAANAAHAAAIAAQSARDEAEAARDAIRDLSVSAADASPGDPVSVTADVDEETGAISLQFAFPKGATAAVPFTNANAVTLTDANAVALANGESYATVIEASYAGTTGDNAELHAEIPLTVTTATTGSDAGGWTINEATVTAQCVSDNAALTRCPQWTLGDGKHTLHAQWIFAVAEANAHVIRLQLQITGGGATVAAGDAVMFISGIVPNVGEGE